VTSAHAIYASGRRRIIIILVVWFWIACVFGGAGSLREAPAIAIPLVIGALTALSLCACAYVPSLWAWALKVNVRWLVALHISRFIGIYFLLLSNRGIPASWALPAGLGDIFIATCAALIVLRHVEGRAVLIWNTAGLVDILFVVLSAMRLGLKDWYAAAFLRELPLSLLPTFLVPLVIASHIWIFVRARTNPEVS
jgi:hypothetical protein